MKNFFRVSTANYAPIKYKFGSSTYQQHFQQRQPFSTAFVIPYSRHRRNNPQPTMVNSYNYPDGVSLSHSDCLCVCLFVFSPCKGIQNSLGFCISTLWISDSRYWIPDFPCHWNLDSGFQSCSNFFRELSQLQKWSKNFRYRITPFMGLL